MKYDIDAIRCYQSVMFEKRQETFFATRQINNRQPIEIYLKSPIKLEQAKKDAAERAKMPTPNIIKKPRSKQTAYRG
jgi:hypothetical protein